MASERLPAAPKGVSARAQRLWRDVVKDFELSSAELEVLRCACEALDRADAATVLVGKEGLTCTDRYGSPKPHPAVDIETRSRSLFARLVGQLGLKLEDEVEAVPPHVSRRAKQAAHARWDRERGGRLRAVQ